MATNNHNELGPYPARVINVPTIESKGIFDERPEAKFAVGMVAVNGAIVNGYSYLFNGASHLRAGTYLEKGFVTENDLDENGTELDKDDERAAHFTVIENVARDGLVRVVSNMRLVVKNGDGPLPVERYYPETFTSPAPDKSFEVSRLISRHEDSSVQSLLKWPLFIAGLKYADEHDLGPAYGLLSPALTRSLQTQRVPVRPLAEAKFIEEINAVKQPVEIDIPRLRNVVNLTGDMDINVSNESFSYLPIGEAGVDEEAM